MKSAAEDWEQCCQPMAHPAASGVSDWRNRFGLSVGASVETHWPARPILAGRFAFVAERLAWETPGSLDALPTGAKYVPGARLGDVVLAAEQRLGDGRIILLADTAPLTDDGNVAAYEFTGRLLDYLANRGDSPQAPWRQFLGLLAAVALVALLAWRPNAWRVSTAAALLAVAWIGCIALSHAATEVLPDGRRHTPNNVAYIDASHLEPYSDRTGDNFGLGNFARTLMRNGYLPLMLPKVSEERLERAGLLVSIAPARPFSDGEREAVSRFVKQGHTLLCMVGAEHGAASSRLLADFECRSASRRCRRVTTAASRSRWGPGRCRSISAQTTTRLPRRATRPRPPNRRMRRRATSTCGSMPLGRSCTAKARAVGVRHEGTAGRPQTARAAGAAGHCRSGDSVEEQAVVVSQRHGKGVVVVIGDTYFAVNANPPPPADGGQPSENAVFWRWLLSRVTDITGGKPWDPPPKAADAGIKENDQPLEPDDEDEP